MILDFLHIISSIIVITIFFRMQKSKLFGAKIIEAMIIFLVLFGINMLFISGYESNLVPNYNLGRLAIFCNILVSVLLYEPKR